MLLADTPSEAAAGVAEELRGLIENAALLPEGSITVSIGVCGVGSADSFDHWLNLADSALYLAKRNGRNRVEVAPSEVVVLEPIARTVPDWR